MRIAEETPNDAQRSCSRPPKSAFAFGCFTFIRNKKNIEKVATEYETLLKHAIVELKTDDEQWIEL